jgi:hypothetical protein
MAEFLSDACLGLVFFLGNKNSDFRPLQNGSKIGVWDMDMFGRKGAQAARPPPRQWEEQGEKQTLLTACDTSVQTSLLSLF